MFRLISVFIALAFSGAGCSPDAKRLDIIDTELQSSYPDIGHLPVDMLAQWQAQGKDMLLIDVREESEFKVSHIKGSIRINPKASASEVAAILGNKASGKDVIFYCSVGVRSSQLANRAKQNLKQLGAHKIYNLSGGIFAWHNKTNTLMDTDGTTQLVHPFDSVWGKLLARKDFISYAPK